MKTKNRMGKSGLLVTMLVIVMALFTVMSVSAETAVCSASTILTGVLSRDGDVVAGIAENCTANDADISLIAYSVYYNSADGTYFTRVTGRVDGSVLAGETTKLTIDIPTCTTKVIFYTGTNPNDPAAQLDRATYNAGKDNYCSEQPPKPPPTNPGTGTPGYWKNHPEAWPNPTITIGGVEYTIAEAIEIMEAPGRGDKTYNMFEHLVAAKLNVAIGNDDSCVGDEITAADEWLTMYQLGSNVRANSDAWDVGEPLFLTLDDYNNGLLCVPHRE